ncbi:unnamed protein product [Peronospora destructor]|uniref:Solute carrier family 40 protein n=1 Tax=Peronospora destructor TaxID=86335 RepID=A0AAV0VDG1_9STRA|nr:unnamed protein product [Peronospora destructor]
MPPVNKKRSVEDLQRGLVVAFGNDALAEFWMVVQSIRYIKLEDMSYPQVVAQSLAVAAIVSTVVLLVCKYKRVGWFCGLQVVIIL